MIRNPFTSARRRASGGFTLIELLTVVAVIGILASILVPVVGGANKTAKRAKSRAQFQGYGTALVAYQSEYGYFPRIGSMHSGGNSTVTQLTSANSRNFIMALSGRTPAGEELSGGNLMYNPRSKPFYSFAEGEFFYNVNTDTVSQDQLADSFNNSNIKIMTDSNGSGIITLDLDDDAARAANLGSNRTFRGKVAIWTEKDNSTPGSEYVFSWN